MSTKESRFCRLSCKLSRIISEGDYFFRRSQYGFLNVWGNLSFPHRPTEQEVSIYEEMIPELAGVRVLILGSTPELRDLFARHGAAVTVVDLSFKMIVGTLQYTRHIVPQKEVWVRGDWLTVPLPPGGYDAVVGDLVLRHVRPKNQDLFFQRVASFASPKSKILLRTHIRDESVSNMSYDQILDRHVYSPYVEKKYEVMGVLFSQLLDKSTTDQEIQKEEVVAAIETYLCRSPAPFSYRLFLCEFLRKRITGLSRPLASQTRKEVENLFSKYFTIERVAGDCSYPESSFYPIYLLKKHD